MCEGGRVERKTQREREYCTTFKAIACFEPSRQLFFRSPEGQRNFHGAKGRLISCRMGACTSLALSPRTAVSGECDARRGTWSGRDTYPTKWRARLGCRSWGGEGNVAGWLLVVRVDYKMIRILSTIKKKNFFFHQRSEFLWSWTITHRNSLELWPQKYAYICWRCQCYNQ